MRRLIIDRFEGKYAICEDADQRCFAIEIQELPEGIKAGCVLDISDEGELALNLEETECRRQRIAEKQSRLFR